MTLPLCKLTGVLVKADGTPAKNIAPGKVRKVTLDGVLLSTVDIDILTDASGNIQSKSPDGAKREGLYLPQGSRAWIWAKEIEGFNKAIAEDNGIPVNIPSLAEYEFRLLIPGAPATSTSASQSALNAEIERATGVEEDLQVQIDGIGITSSVVIEISEDTALDLGEATKALVLIDTTDGDVTATLQPLADMANREIIFKKVADDNLAVIDADDMELIDDSLVFNLEMNNQFIVVMPGAGQWRIVGKG